MLKKPNGFTGGASHTVNEHKDLFKVDSPNVVYTDKEINTKYVYRTTAVSKTETGSYVATPKETSYDFKVDRKVGKVGMMLVGWGGNKRHHCHCGYHRQSSGNDLGYSRGPQGCQLLWLGRHGVYHEAWNRGCYRQRNQYSVP